jgi:hypothetical protein
MSSLIVVLPVYDNAIEVMIGIGGSKYQHVASFRRVVCFELGEGSGELLLSF